MAAGACLSAPGQAALLPEWICSGAVYGLVHAGVRPVLCDVDDTFNMSLQHAQEVAERFDVAMVVLAPYGGFPVEFGRWEAWASMSGAALVADVAQAPDTLAWRRRRCARDGGGHVVPG